MASVPPFPGAAKTVDTFVLAARALTMACSRPPEPTTTTEAMGRVLCCYAPLSRVLHLRAILKVVLYACLAAT